MRQRLSLLFWLVSMAACGSPPGAPDAATDAAMRSPDGLGVCCPLGRPSCDCTPLGGFAATAAECSIQSYCDAPPSAWGGTSTDAHGCPRLDVRPYPYPNGDCCNCPADAGM